MPGRARHERNNHGVEFSTLIYQVTAGAPAVNLDCDRIFTGPDVVRDLEFRRRLAAFAVTHVFAIYPDVES